MQSKKFFFLLYGGLAFSTLAVLQHLSSNSYQQQTLQTIRRQEEAYRSFELNKINETSSDTYESSTTSFTETSTVITEIVTLKPEISTAETTITPFECTLYSSTKFLRNFISVELTPNEPVGLLLIVKSARCNFERRETVRQTWGDSSYLQNISSTFDKPIQLYFLVGLDEDADHPHDAVRFYDESEKYKDIILADFHDTYRNNTLKTILALRWALEVFPNKFDYLSLVDDDVFVNATNMVNYLKKIPETKVVRKNYESVNMDFLTEYSSERDQSVDNLSVFNLSDIPLYTGSLFAGSEVLRTPGSPYYVSKEVYAPDVYPIYFSGAGTLMDKRTVEQFYNVAHYVKYIAIDDAFMGILASKVGILPLLNSGFYVAYDLNGVQPIYVPKMILIHGFRCPSQMVEFWKTQRLRDFENKC